MELCGHGRWGRVEAMRLIAFLQAWDLLRDELGREPGLGEFAERFAVSAETAREQWSGFEAACPGLAPGEVLDLLWKWCIGRLKDRTEVPIAQG